MPGGGLRYTEPGKNKNMNLFFGRLGNIINMNTRMMNPGEIPAAVFHAGTPKGQKKLSGKRIGF